MSARSYALVEATGQPQTTDADTGEIGFNSHYCHFSTQMLMGVVNNNPRRLWGKSTGGFRRFSLHFNFLLVICGIEIIILH